MSLNSETKQVDTIIEKHITYINGDVETKGWLGEMVMGLVSFHPNRAQISLGKSLAVILKEISKITYEVPEFIAGAGVSIADAEKTYHSLQISTTDVPIFTHYCYPELSALTNKEVQLFLESKKKNKKRRIDNSFFNEIVEKTKKEVSQQENLVPVYVDLSVIQNGNVAIELKSTAHEDSSGARQTLVERIIIPHIIMPDNSRVVLGIAANNQGWKKNGEWKGCLGSWLSSEHIVIEDEMWNLIGPKNVSFDYFKEAFKRRFTELVEKQGYGR